MKYSIKDAIHMSALKSFARGLVPLRWQVPLKYWYNWTLGTLEGEMSLLGYVVRRGDRAVDVGGNRGVYAYKLWKLGAEVEVFEPNPMCLRVLEAWARARPGVQVHPVALSSQAGEASLHIPVDATGIEHDASASIEHEFGRARTQAVRLASLDSFGFRNVALVKVDVEGHEYSVVEGAAMTLATSRPALLVEIEQRHSDHPIAEVFAKILEFGYEGFFMRDGTLVALESFAVTRDQNSAYFGCHAERYINNFLFLHRSRLADGQYRALLEGMHSS